MTARFDPLESHESLRRPFMSSLLMHAVLFTVTFLYSWMLARGHIQFGDPNALPGGSIPINVVKGIPLSPAQTLTTNPVANNTKSSVPTPPPEKEAPKAQEKSEAPEENAIALPGPSAQARPKRTPLRNFRPYVPDRDNQLYSMSGMGLNTPSYTGVQQNAFGVGVGVGAGSPFGSQYGWYAEALQRRIGEQWQKELGQVDATVRVAPRTVVDFEIQRDGSIRNARVAQSSGNSSLDYSALRAVSNSNPMPPLPSGIGRNSISTEVWFQLKR